MLHLVFVNINYVFYILVSNPEASVLNITRINRQHMGTYICEANNGIPPNARKEFRVNVLCKHMIMDIALSILSIHKTSSFMHVSGLNAKLIIIFSSTNVEDTFSDGWWIQTFFRNSNLHCRSLSTTSKLLGKT